MGDLAELWSWAPATMNDMTLAELLGWRADALERAKRRAQRER
ncbi:GpE family phage tail protein [Sphingomonas pseudosanguinis]|uniref:GpE family phage tail protein n=1 Tax=Sphingomonas pseudosanguinis TaxID=413712 RepID=A0A7W6A690_9SPHN|nr:GpE family phage tail protein [Sphingomonas pseudosanguinis]MBB3877909.1 hypothetical protein [Sphingomonas pseudosanguinis]MBN3537782.1 GpE family phage tail protein [Sphingomonas pseudosanguinis]